jgi:hypothetical protein
MTKTLLRCVFLAALAAGVSVPASAGELKLTMKDGRVTLIADNVPVRQILQEWARIGQARIVNLEKLSGPNVTLQLVDTPERDALDILLRSATGYIAAPRTTPLADAAVFDRVTIFVSTARPPAQVAGAAPPPTFQRPPVADVDDEPINVAMPPQMIGPNNPMANPNIPQYQGLPQPQATMPPNLPPQMQQQLMQQMQQQQTTSPMPGPLMSPRPGVPQPPQPMMPNGIPNPYQPVPTGRPGGGGPGGPGGN